MAPTMPGRGLLGQSRGAAKGMGPPPQQPVPSRMGVPAHPWVLPGWGCTNHSPPTPSQRCPWGGWVALVTPTPPGQQWGGAICESPPHGCWQDGGWHVQPRGSTGTGVGQGEAAEGVTGLGKGGTTPPSRP